MDVEQSPSPHITINTYSTNMQEENSTSAFQKRYTTKASKHMHSIMPWVLLWSALNTLYPPKGFIFHFPFHWTPTDQLKRWSGEVCQAQDRQRQEEWEDCWLLYNLLYVCGKPPGTTSGLLKSMIICFPYHFSHFRCTHSHTTFSLIPKVKHQVSWLSEVTVSWSQSECFTQTPW